MLKIYGLNVDAFKASKAAPFFRQMHEEHADVVCIQETGATSDLFPSFAQMNGYDIAENHDPHAPGRTGVALLSRHTIRAKNRTLCDHVTCQGRFVEATIGNLKVASVYAHAHDSKDQQRWPHRKQFNACLGDYMCRNADQPCIILLDANVALSRADVANDTQWKGPWADGNKSAYRNPIVEAMDRTGWADAYRVVHGSRRRATVWVPRKFAPANGTEAGYGIDFHLVSRPVVPQVRGADVFKPRTWAERFSDHAPTLGLYDIALN